MEGKDVVRELFVADLKNTDLNSEVFMKKLHRAQEALSQSDGSGTSSVKTLSASFGTKWPYKRTMSAPASMIRRQDTKQGMFPEFLLIIGYLLFPDPVASPRTSQTHIVHIYVLPFFSCFFRILSRRKGKGVQPTVFRAHPEKEELEIRTGSVVGVYPA